ncbi:MAG: TonB-dependent receptor, partial [Bacteroidota bacterium]
MEKRLINILAMLTLCYATTFAQVTIKGEVFDETLNEALIGANIVIKGTTTGTVTDWDGSFQLKSKDASLPLTLVVTYLGYTDKEIEVTSTDEKVRITLSENAIVTEVVEVKGQRISEKQKAAPLTVESMDLLAIKETPSDNFYDGLGSMKGVDLTAASLGFKVVNTRGFNSTSPVRSLQIIDGVDNQAPGLNFSLGNFLGTSELDVVKVDLVVGASSAYYGPNAFNGVISMETKNPFYQKGLGAMVKGGERNLLETAVRWADVVKNKNGDDFLGYKFNISYLRADDWEADNFDPVFNTDTGVDNPGRYDAVNIYGDEYSRNYDLSEVDPWSPLVGLGQWHRTGYKESDLVDYDTRNTKANIALHFRTAPSAKEESPEFILSSSYGSGTTVYQGDNRFSLKNIQFFQNRIEFRKRGKYFIRAYSTHENSGDSYDPYFTALRLQEESRTSGNWGIQYTNFWQGNIAPRLDALGYPDLEFIFDENGNLCFDENGLPKTSFDQTAADQFLIDFKDSLNIWHSMAEEFANFGAGDLAAIEVGTERFDTTFNRIISSRSNGQENGTGFDSNSALYHVHGEYNFTTDFLDEIRVGANARYYTPKSRGTIFFDTLDISITNFEMGYYAGFSKKLGGEKNLTLSATIRADKNENFNWLFSPAASLVWKPKPSNYFRVSFSSGVRNPTLTDQFLFLNVGPAILAGNLTGVDSLITTESFLDYIDRPNPETLEYFNISAVRPEKVRTIELGYRSTLFNSLYVDASYYFNFYDDFLGFQLGVDSDFNEFGFPVDVQAFRYSANSNNRVTTQGFAIGLNYYFLKYFQVSGNYSWNRLNKQFDDDPIIPAYNTPEHKFNVGISGRNIKSGPLKNFGFNLNYKWIQ